MCPKKISYTASAFLETSVSYGVANKKKPCQCEAFDQTDTHCIFRFWGNATKDGKQFNKLFQALIEHTHLVDPRPFSNNIFVVCHEGKR
jgi:hypothetical protein